MADSVGIRGVRGCGGGGEECCAAYTGISELIVQSEGSQYFTGAVLLHPLLIVTPLRPLQLTHHLGGLSESSNQVYRLYECERGQRIDDRVRLRNVDCEIQRVHELVAKGPPNQPM